MQDLLKDIVPSPDGAERPSKLPDELRKADKATATSPEAKPEKTHRVKFFRRIFRFNKATSTQEDQQSPDPSRPPVKGPDPKNMKGPSSRSILYVHYDSLSFMIFMYNSCSLQQCISFTFLRYISLSSNLHNTNSITPALPRGTSETLLRFGQTLFLSYLYLFLLYSTICLQ